MENKNIILIGILLLLIFAGGGTGIYFYIDSKKCKPKCNECGDNGCGGDCGSCPTGSSCDKKSGLCVAKKNNNCSCKDKTCGFDGCGKSCGICNEGEICNNGKCCKPNCDGKDCDSDGCGGDCGTCNEGEICNNGKCCKPNCDGKDCGSDGCGGDCGKCSDPQQQCINNKCINSGWNWVNIKVKNESDLDLETKISAQDCYDKCFKNKNCKYFTYSPTLNGQYSSCILYNNVIEDEEKCVQPVKYSISYDMSKNIPVSEANKCKGCSLKRDLTSCPKDKDNNILEEKDFDSKCYNSKTNNVVCCVNNGSSGYNDCIKTFKDCTKIDGVEFPYYYTFSCNSTNSIFTPSELKKVKPGLLKSCNNKKENDTCLFTGDQISFNGKCNDCGEGQICLPEKICEPEMDINKLFIKSNGTCTSNFGCI